MNSPASCPFCDLKTSSKHYGQKILYEDDNFIILPVAGPLLTGHLLLITKAHYHSFLSMPPMLIDHASKLVAQTLTAVTPLLGEYYIFENGYFDNKKPPSSRSLEHMHLHLFPAPGFKQKIIDTAITAGGKPKEIPLSEISKVADQYAEEYYLIIDNQTCLIWPQEKKGNLRSRFSRNVAAECLGQPELADWHNNPGLDKIKETNQVVGPLLANLKL